LWLHFKKLKCLAYVQVFDVMIEGDLKLDDFDIFATVGANTGK